jgi:hypothetical protein
MFEKKPALVATIVALSLIGAPIAASANPAHSPKTISGISIHAEDKEGHDDGDEDEDDEDEDHHGSIPPVFVVPGKKKPHHDRKHNQVTTPPTTSNPATIDPVTGLPVTSSSIDPVTSEEFVVVGAGETPTENNLGGVNPKQARAIDIKQVKAGMRTPADQFMDTAYLGMGMLGIAALGLGVTAGVRSIRLRRAGKSDYFYGDK